MLERNTPIKTGYQSLFFRQGSRTPPCPYAERSRSILNIQAMASSETYSLSCGMTWFKWNLKTQNENWNAWKRLQRFEVMERYCFLGWWIYSREAGGCASGNLLHSVVSLSFCCISLICVVARLVLRVLFYFEILKCLRGAPFLSIRYCKSFLCEIKNRFH